MNRQSVADRLQLLRFPLVCAVVLYHNHHHSVRVGGAELGGPLAPWADFLQRFFAETLTSVRVPLFFLIAGLLFFVGSGEAITPPAWRRKLWTRTQTLLLPLVAWGTLWYVGIALLGRLPSFEALFTGATPWHLPLEPIGLRPWFEAVFGPSDMPMVYPLWFIRDLFLMCLAAPLLPLLRRAVGPALPWLALAGWLAAGPWLAGPTLRLVEGASMFTLGAALAMDGRAPWQGERAWPALLALFLTVTVARLLWAVPEALGYPIARATQAVAMLGLLGMTGALLQCRGVAARLHTLAGSSFVVFALHEPLLTVLRKTAYVLLQPQSDALRLGLFLGLAALTVTLCVVVDRLLLRRVPLLARLFVGRAAKPAATARWQELRT